MRLQLYLEVNTPLLEVLALEQIIKENIQSDAMMKRENIILKANLIVYLSDLAESFNAEIVNL